jgi:tetratricopeptide (TPR) repeat protein
LFDDWQSNRIFWSYKWICEDLTDFPRISREQALAILADMQRRYDLAGHGSSGVLGCRFLYAVRTGSPDAEEIRRQWIAVPRDEFSDCRACVPATQADFFYETGRYDDLVALAERLHGSCMHEPSGGLSSLAIALLARGEPVAAQRAYQKAVRTLNPDASPLTRGKLLEFLLRGGQVSQALSRLRSQDALLLERAPAPMQQLRFLLSLLAGLSAALAEHGDEPTGLSTVPAPTVRDLHAFVLFTATAHAAEFDVRNGNCYYADFIARALTAQPAAVPLAPAAPAGPPGGPAVPVVEAVEPGPLPVTMGRIQAILDDAEVNYDLDDSGGIASGWDGNPYWFHLVGDRADLLRAHAQWQESLGPERRVAALEAANEWNTSRLFPRAAVGTDDTGDVVFIADHQAAFEFGVTDEQLRNEIFIAISTGLQFFEFLAEKFPSSVEGAEGDHRDLQ